MLATKRGKYFIVKVQYNRKSNHYILNVCRSVRLSTWYNLTAIGRIYTKNNISAFVENTSR